MTTTAVTLAAESLGSFPVAVPWPSEMVDDIPVISLSVGLEGESLYRMRTVEGSGQSGVNERVPAPNPPPCPVSVTFRLPHGLVIRAADPQVTEPPADCELATEGQREREAMAA